MTSPTRPPAKTAAIILIVPTVPRRIIHRPAPLTRVMPNVPKSNTAKTKDTPNLLKPVMTLVKHGIRTGNVPTALTGTKNAVRTRLRPVKTTDMSTTVPALTKLNCANGMLLMPNAAMTRRPKIVRRIQRSRAVRAALLSAKIPAVMTAGNAVKPLVRPDMLILTRRPRAAQQAISKMETTIATIAQKANFTSVKRIPVTATLPVRLTAAWITAITAIPAVQKSIPNALTVVKTVILSGAQCR